MKIKTLTVEVKVNDDHDGGFVLVPTDNKRLLDGAMAVAPSKRRKEGEPGWNCTNGVKLKE